MVLAGSGQHFGRAGVVVAGRTPPIVLRAHVDGVLKNGTLSGTYTVEGRDDQTDEVVFSDTATFSGLRISAYD
jgi:hypothetical protein